MPALASEPIALQLCWHPCAPSMPPEPHGCRGSFLPHLSLALLWMLQVLLPPLFPALTLSFLFLPSPLPRPGRIQRHESPVGHPREPSPQPRPPPVPPLAGAAPPSLPFPGASRGKRPRLGKSSPAPLRARSSKPYRHPDNECNNRGSCCPSPPHGPRGRWWLPVAASGTLSVAVSPPVGAGMSWLASRWDFGKSRIVPERLQPSQGHLSPQLPQPLQAWRSLRMGIPAQFIPAAPGPAPLAASSQHGPGFRGRGSFQPCSLPWAES